MDRSRACAVVRTAANCTRLQQHASNRKGKQGGNNAVAPAIRKGKSDAAAHEEVLNV